MCNLINLNARVKIPCMACPLSIQGLSDRVCTKADAYLFLEELRWGDQPVCLHYGLGHKFFENDYIAFYEVDRVIAEAAQDMVWQHGVKKDAIHFVTAITAAGEVCIEQLDIFDSDLIGLSGQIGQPPHFPSDGLTFNKVSSNARRRNIQCWPVPTVA